MGIVGNRFLELSGAKSFIVTTHALERMREFAGFRPTSGLAHVWFSRSRQLSHQEMLQLGYRPSYEHRRAEGIKSWYFRFFVFADEMVAVVGEGEIPGEYIWLTTYGRNLQNDQLSMFGSPAMAMA